jgi:formylglycine-generating enzyme required for sulfatase activity
MIFIGAMVFWPRRNTATGDHPLSPTQLSVVPQQDPIGDQPTSQSKAPDGMVYVPGGTFLMGRDDGDDYERPAHSVTVKPFFIDIYEVTNEDYAKFVKATNRLSPKHWTSGIYPVGSARKPVTAVTLDDALAYARWMSKRLPTEEEWEFTARGGDKNLRYPWGNEWRKGMANADGARDGIADVGTYRGSSQFGVFDMIGNVWEWTTSDMAPYVGGKLPEKPPANTKVLRGGSFKSSKNQATATYRFGWRASEEASYTETGFRCVKDLPND